MSEKLSLVQQLQTLCEITATLEHKLSFKLKGMFYKKRRQLKKYIASGKQDIDTDYPT